MPKAVGDAFGDSDPKRWFWNQFDFLGGGVLTLTVQYADGATATKVYDLASGPVKVVYDENGGNPRSVPEFVEDVATQPFSYGLIATLREGER